MQVGFGKGKITPTGGKIVIAGRIPVRYTDVVHDDVWATAMVVQNNGVRTIWVSLDICHPTRRLTEDVIAALKDKIADFKREELILNATHATACFYLTDDEYINAGVEVEIDKIMPLHKTRKQVVDGVLEAVESAILNMQNCTMEFSTADILTGFCRRVVFEDGSAEMYGNPHREDFLRMEYPDGQSSQYLYFYTEEKHELVGVFANVPCPAQAAEGEEHITGDFWTTVRSRIREAFGENVEVIAACRAAGELSPHRILYTAGGYNKNEWDRIAAKRLGDHIADSIIREKNLPLKKYSIEELAHNRITKTLSFPIRRASEQDRVLAEEYFKNDENFDQDGKPKNIDNHLKYAHVRRLFEDEISVYDAAVSAVKIADVLFFTAPVELFTEYSKRIAMRFPKNPIFDVQLTNDCLGYLPTKEAVAHGGYSTHIFSTLTTTEGGEKYVEEVSKLLAELAE